MPNQHLERLDGLATWLQPSVRELVERCQHQLGRTLMIVHGWRSSAEQLLVYQKGRIYDRERQDWVVSDQAAVVTNAKPGTSAHNVVTRNGAPASVAIDVVPFLTETTLDWAAGIDFWNQLYGIAWKVGLDPLGDAAGSYLKGDRGHFEEPGWRLKLDGFGLILPTSLIPKSVDL